MIVTLEPVADFGLLKRITVTVEAADIEPLYKLIKPARPLRGGINKKLHTLTAIVQCKYGDGSSREVYIRWTGQNPAAVSFDDERYFSAEAGNSPDGALAIIQLLLPRTTYIPPIDSDHFPVIIAASGPATRARFPARRPPRGGRFHFTDVPLTCNSGEI